ncbi:uncharacterized protein LOC132727883 isoform X3 [Ruditapes philippinarum]|uniref:uncharacterized protein LOC132727883 isoform X3 n=1 Tax=Ruditapes philippinarum TaxID=129788 RepID=UPI00295ACAB9|nr:uncharacterized protein LOC132727883 isoform X3 [Ruditapes philippinarum]
MRLLLFSLILPFVLGGAIPGKEKCVWGPPYWCSHVTHARECGATQHCLQTVWKNQIIKPESIKTCTYCELIVNAFRDAIQQPPTQTQIEAVLANVCAILPDSDTRDMCQGIIKEYVPELIQMFENDITTDMICATLGLCSGLEDRWSPFGVKASNSTDYCSDCTRFFTDVQQSITSNETLNQLLQLLNQTLCNELGVFSETCIDLAKQYLPVALQTLASQLDPNIVCRIFGFCSTNSEIDQAIMMKNIFNERSSKDVIKYRSDEECVLCQDFVKELDTLMEDPAKQTKLFNLIKNNFCAETGSFIIQCHHLADGYIRPLITIIANKLQMDPTITCKIVGLCASADVKDDMQQMMKKMFTVRKSKGVITSDEECVLCQDFVKELDTLMEDSAKQTELYTLIRKYFCSKTGSFGSQCHQLADAYIRPLITMLANKLQMDPTITCKIVGLCASADTKVDMMQMMKKMFTIRKSKGVVGNKVGDEECDVCKDLINQVDELIRDKANQDKFIYEVKNVVCPELGTLQDQCKELVDEYAPMLFELLVNELDPSTFCEEVGFCPVPSVTTVELTKVEEPAGMVGAGYVKQSEECTICLTIQTYVDNLLKKNDTVKTIDDLLDKVCKRLPTKLLDEHCEDFVQKFGHEMIDKLSKENVCQLIDVCPKQKAQVKKISDGKCELCQLFVSVSESLVANVSEDVILNDLRGLCSVIPGNFSATCLNYVNVYGPLVISALKTKEDPKTLCQLMTACPAKHLPYMTKPIPETLPALKAPSKECEFCDTAVVMVKYLLENKATEAELEKALDGLCKYASSLAPVCTSLVALYGDKIIALVISELNANEICSTLRLCTEMKKQAPALSAIMSPYDILPVGKVVENEKASVKVPSKECELCDTVVVMIKYYLNSNQTDDEIKAAMEALCGEIPAEEISGLCKSLVDQYAFQIIELLRKELNATYICTKLGFCKALTKQVSAVSVIMSPYDTLPIVNPVENKPVVQTSEQCELCKEAINMMKSYITKKSTREEIKKVVETFCTKVPSVFKSKCDNLIQQYGDIIINLLVQEADAEKICEEIKQCVASISDIMSPYDTLPIVQPVSNDKVSEKAGNVVECEACKYVMNFLDKELQNNKTEENIKAALKEICSKMPSEIKDQCTKLVDQYAQAVINFLIMDMSPDEICKALSLCDSKVKQLPKPVHVKLLKDAKGAVAGPTECEVCKIVLKVVDTFLGENRTEASIKEVLDRVCSALPDTISSECEQLVNTYSDVLIKLLLQNLDPETICKQIKLCTAQTRKTEGTIKASVTCVICEFALKEIDDYLKGNRSVAAITTALEEVCSLMPDTITTECKEFVDKYSKVIISLLVQNIDPTTICTRIGLCTGKSVSSLENIIPLKTKGTIKASVTCVICEFALKEIDDYLKGNRSVAAITTALEEVCSLMPDTITTECKEFVEKYSKVIISLLVQNIDPTTICTRIGLCTGKSVSSLENIIPLKTKVLGNLKSSVVTCETCKYIMSYVKTLLKDNKTEAAVQEALDKVCSYLPAQISDQCTAFVNEYTDMVVQLIANDVSPDQVCTAIGLCSSGKKSQWGAFVKILPDKQKAKSDFCGPCKFLVDQLQEFLKENRTAKEIEEYMRKLCDILPDTVTAQCHDVVDQYIPAILDLIGQNLKPEEICKQLGFCNATVAQKKDDKTLFFKSHKLVGTNKCTYGPAYWCANKDNAAECNAMEHCLRHVWN